MVGYTLIDVIKKHMPKRVTQTMNQLIFGSHTMVKLICFVRWQLNAYLQVLLSLYNGHVKHWLLLATELLTTINI